MLVLHRSHQTGFGLVDMMIAMTLSVVMLGGMLSAYVATINGHGNVAKIARLDHEMHALMELMSRDIRRAGSHGNPSALATGASNPFTLDTPAAYTSESANSCLTFSYDLDADGSLDTGSDDERFGFRLKNKVIQMRRAGLDCTMDGSPANWEDVTDGSVVEITGLSFTATNTTAEDMTLRRMQVQLSGRLKNDPDVSRTLTKTVRIRNDLYSPS